MAANKFLNKNCAGFTLLEALIALVILTGGLLALASAFSEGMIVVTTAHYHQIAKEKATEAIESVFTSRDTRIIVWNAVRNVSKGGVFLDDPQPIRDPGPDGMVNTADDGSEEAERLPGADNQLGTPDDIVVPLNTFTREIEITDLGGNLRQIRIIIDYRIGHLNRQYELVTYISSFA
ncbi:MAG: prepilin-type N-terminal cleavage/methylation domain-containing protein [Acidobacteria bacterium]|nr:prepilin-type N-terminal cleavage/methylation domain-containing protein [Acidobacteriota bacterium]